MAYPRTFVFCVFIAASTGQPAPPPQPPDLKEILGRETQGGVGELRSQGGAGAGPPYKNGMRGTWDGNPNIMDDEGHHDAVGGEHWHGPGDTGHGGTRGAGEGHGANGHHIEGIVGAETGGIQGFLDHVTGDGEHVSTHGHGQVMEPPNTHYEPKHETYKKPTNPVSSKKPQIRPMKQILSKKPRIPLKKPIYTKKPHIHPKKPIYTKRPHIYPKKPIYTKKPNILPKQRIYPNLSQYGQGKIMEPANTHYGSRYHSNKPKYASYKKPKTSIYSKKPQILPKQRIYPNLSQYGHGQDMGLANTHYGSRYHNYKPKYTNHKKPKTSIYSKKPHIHPKKRIYPNLSQYGQGQIMEPANTHYGSRYHSYEPKYTSYKKPKTSIYSKKPHILPKQRIYPNLSQYGHGQIMEPANTHYGSRYHSYEPKYTSHKKPMTSIYSKKPKILPKQRIYPNLSQYGHGQDMGPANTHYGSRYHNYKPKYTSHKKPKTSIYSKKPHIHPKKHIYPNLSQYGHGQIMEPANTHYGSRYHSYKPKYTSYKKPKTSIYSKKPHIHPKKRTYPNLSHYGHGQIMGPANTQYGSRYHSYKPKYTTHKKPHIHPKKQIYRMTQTYSKKPHIRPQKHIYPKKPTYSNKPHIHPKKPMYRKKPHIHPIKPMYRKKPHIHPKKPMYRKKPHIHTNNPIYPKMPHMHPKKPIVPHHKPYKAMYKPKPHMHSHGSSHLSPLTHNHPRSRKSNLHKPREPMIPHKPYGHGHHMRSHIGGY